MNTNKLLKQLKDGGSRITKARSAMIEIFQSDHLPLTALALKSRLAKRKIRVNKSTIYRELSYLKKMDAINEVDFGDGKKRYESSSKSHHHHLICTNCKRVDEIQIENDLSLIEKMINKQKKFKTAYHSLEFFGLCNSCTKD